MLIWALRAGNTTECAASALLILVWVAAFPISSKSETGFDVFVSLMLFFFIFFFR